MEKIKHFYQQHQTIFVNILGMAAILVLGVIYLVTAGAGGGEEIAAEIGNEEDGLVSSSQKEIEENQVTFFAEISGQVVNPGVYQVNEGTMLIELLELAGGLTNEADLLYVHRDVSLAQQVNAGSNYYFPAEVEAVTGSGNESMDKSTGGKVNINQATLTELTELPGVGEKTAEAIISNRPYAQVQDLLSVDGIGDKTLERLVDLLEL